MPATLPKIQNGFFSPNGSPINQTFFNAAFAGRLSGNPVFKETYWCNLVEDIGFNAFLDEYTGWDTFGYSSFTNVEYSPYYDQVKITNAAATVPAYSAGTNTVVVPIDTTKSQFYATYVLPQVGQTVVAPPYGALLEVVAVTASGGTPSMTLRHRSTTGAQFVIPAASEMKVLIGKYLADCDCPSGLLRVPDLPIARPLTMKPVGTSSGVICGKALIERQNLKYDFYNEDGTVSEVWYNPWLKKMYKDFETDKLYKRMLDPDWGLYPTLVARGGIWTTASSTEVTVDDVYAWGDALTLAGVTCRDFAIPCGRDLFVQFQRLLNQEGVDKTLIGIFDSADDCKWLNLNWCRLSVGGLNLHIFEEPWMSNGLGLGASGYNFKKSGIAIPLCNRPDNLRENEIDGMGNTTNKMITTVYLKDNLGRVWDNLQDGNGIWGPRNTFGVGCDNQEWSVKSEFTQEIHCPQQWALINFL
jgi:hypothetical protein